MELRQRNVCHPSFATIESEDEKDKMFIRWNNASSSAILFLPIWLKCLVQSNNNAIITFKDLPTGMSPNTVSVHPSEPYVLIAATESPELVLLNIENESSSVLKVVEITERIVAVSYTLDSKKVLIVTAYGKLYQTSINREVAVSPPEILIDLSTWHLELRTIALAPPDWLAILGGTTQDGGRRTSTTLSSSITLWKSESSTYELESFMKVVGDTIGHDLGWWDSCKELTSSLFRRPFLTLEHLGWLSAVPSLIQQDDVTLRGTVQQVAVEETSLLLAMLDYSGKVCVRQLDSWQEFLPWYELENHQEITRIAWFKPKVLAVLSKEGAIYYLTLEDECQNPILVQTDDNDDELKILDFVKTSDDNLMLLTSSDEESDVSLVTVSCASAELLLGAKLEARDYEGAMEVALQYPDTLHPDMVHKIVWETEPMSSKTIRDHLEKITQDDIWVLNEICSRIPTSHNLMEKLLRQGLLQVNKESFESVNSRINGDEIRSHILKYLDRLESMTMILKTESAKRVENNDVESFYTAEMFRAFREAPILDVAMSLAQQMRLSALKVLVDRYGYTLLPFRLQILTAVPCICDPREYAFLLPVVPEEAVVAGRYFCFNKDFEISPCVLRNANKLHDWDREVGESRDDIEDSFKAASLKQVDIVHLSKIFYERTIAIDSQCGMLSYALDFCHLGIKCISPSVTRELLPDEADAVAELKHLYEEIKCLCSILEVLEESNERKSRELLGLDEWLSMSKLERLRLMLEKANPTEIVTRLEIVYLNSTYMEYGNESLEWCDALQQYLCSSASEGFAIEGGQNDDESSSCWSGLQVAEQVIAASNPLQPLRSRIVKGGVRLLDIAIQCIYACPKTDAIVVETMWNIFQNLPERDPEEEKRNPRFAQLQVLVDDMEAHIGAAELLSKYDVSVPMQVFQQAATQAIASGAAAVDDDDKTLGSLGKQVLQKVCSSFENKVLQNPSAYEVEEWETLLTDLNSIRDHAFTWVDSDVILEMMVTSMLAAGAFDAAKPILFGKRSTLSKATAHKVVLNSCREAINSAASTSHPSLDTAASILGLVPPSVLHETPDLLVENNLLRALEMLSTFGMESVPPLQVRLCSNRMEFIDQILNENPRAYASRDYSDGTNDGHVRPGLALLHIAELLDLKTPEEYSEVLSKAARAALFAADYDCACKLVLQLFESFRAHKDCLDLALNMAMDISSCGSYRDLESKLELCGCALGFGSWEDKDEFMERFYSRWEILNAIIIACKALEVVPQHLHWNISNDQATSVEHESASWLLGALAKRYEESNDGESSIIYLQAGLLLIKALARTTDGENHQVNPANEPFVTSECLIQALAEKSLETDPLQSISYLLAIPDGVAAEGTIESVMNKYVVGGDGEYSSEREAVARTAEHFFILLALANKQQSGLQKQQELYHQSFSYCQSQLSVLETDLMKQCDDDDEAKKKLETYVDKVSYYHSQADATRKSMLLQKSLSGVDVEKFAAEEEYRDESMLKLVQSHDPEQFSKAKQLASDHNLDTWPLYMEHIRYMILQPPEQEHGDEDIVVDSRTFEDFQALLESNEVYAETLQKNPLAFGQAFLNDDFFEAIPGTSLGCLEFVCRMLLECSKLQQKQRKMGEGVGSELLLTEQSQVDFVVLQIQFLRKWQKICPAGILDYRVLAGIESSKDLFMQRNREDDDIDSQRRILEAVLEVLTTENLKDGVMLACKMHSSFLNRSLLLWEFMVKNLMASCESEDAVMCYDIYCFPFLEKLNDDWLLALVLHLIGDMKDFSPPLHRLVTGDDSVLYQLSSRLPLDKKLEIVSDSLQIITSRQEMVEKSGTKFGTSEKRIEYAILLSRIRFTILYQRILCGTEGSCRPPENVRDNEDLLQQILSFSKAEGAMSSSGVTLDSICLLLLLAKNASSLTEKDRIFDEMELIWSIMMQFATDATLVMTEFMSEWVSQLLLVDTSSVWKEKQEFIKLHQFLSRVFKRENDVFLANFEDMDDELKTLATRNAESVCKCIREKLISSLEVPSFAKLLILECMPLEAHEDTVKSKMMAWISVMWPEVEVLALDSMENLDSVLSNSLLNSISSVDQARVAIWVLTEREKMLSNDHHNTTSSWIRSCCNFSLDQRLEELSMDSTTEEARITTEDSSVSAYWASILQSLVSLKETSSVLEYYQRFAFRHLSESQVSDICEEMYLSKNTTASGVIMGLLSPFVRIHEVIKTERLKSAAVRREMKSNADLASLLLLRYPFSFVSDLSSWKFLQKRILKNREGINSAYRDIFTSTLDYQICALLMLKRYPEAMMLLCLSQKMPPLLSTLNTGQLLLPIYLRKLESNVTDPRESLRSFIKQLQVVASSLANS